MRWLGPAVLAIASIAVLGAEPPQSISANDAYRMKGMLKHAHEAVKKHYYDPTFAGLDWDARYAEYLTKVDAAPHLAGGLSIVAGFLDGLQDSHTWFMPPAWSRRVDYGYDVGFIGDDPYVLTVRSGTDAEKKLKPGDRVLGINGNPVTRENIGRMRYILNVLSPMVSTRVAVRAPDGTERTEVVNSKVTDGRALDTLGAAGGGIRVNDMIREMEDAQLLIRHRAVTVGPVYVWKAPTFLAEDDEIDRMSSRARNSAAVVLDLRGNPGGYVAALRRMIGGVFQTHVTVGTRVTRTGRRPIIAQTRGDRSFSGTLFVLIDASSASSAELFARVVQLEGRGRVIGDRSSGAVREALMHAFTQGADVIIGYAISVTSADILMKDGVSLERRGVVPDEVQLPTGADLAAGRDPVLAHAIRLAGGDTDPVAAAKLFANGGR